jgi:transposase-like protein
MPRSGPRTVRRYSDAFTLAAVRLSQEPRVKVLRCAASDRASHSTRLQGSCGVRPQPH